MASGEQKFKIVVLGEAGVGKTSLVDRFVNNFYTDIYQTTVSLDIHKKQITVDGRKVTLEVWDTAGCERFHSLSVGFYRGATGCLLVYDVTSPNSFIMLETWRDNFLLACAARKPDTFPFVVVGNKIDMPCRSVTTKRAENWCSSNGSLPYFETSARDSTNVNLVFQEIARCAMGQSSPPDRNSIRLQRNDSRAMGLGRVDPMEVDDDRRSCSACQ